MVAERDRKIKEMRSDIRGLANVCAPPLSSACIPDGVFRLVCGNALWDVM